MTPKRVNNNVDYDKINKLIKDIGLNSNYMETFDARKMSNKRN